jgi:hypothetical protein
VYREIQMMSLRTLRTTTAANTLLLVALALVACQETEEEPSPTVDASTAATDTAVSAPPTPVTSETPAAETTAPRTAGPGETLYRWANLEVLIPDGLGIIGSPGAVEHPGKPLHFLIVKVDPDDSRIASTVVLDSETGAIVEEQVLEQHRSDINRVLTTVRVAPFDRTAAPWPYNGEPTADLARETAGGIVYIEPSPDSGLYMGFGIGDPCCQFIDISNERSKAFLQFRPEGPLFDTSMVHEEDMLVFDRWFGAIRQCGADVQC